VRQGAELRREVDEGRREGDLPRLTHLRSDSGEQRR
jgi:hypothetical protein